MRVLNEVTRTDEEGNALVIGTYSLGSITETEHNNMVLGLGRLTKVRVPDNTLVKAKETTAYLRKRLDSVRLTDGTVVGQVVGNMRVPAGLADDHTETGEYCIEVLWKDARMLPLAAEADLEIATDGSVTLKGSGA